MSEPQSAQENIDVAEHWLGLDDNDPRHEAPDLPLAQVHALLAIAASLKVIAEHVQATR